MRVPSVLIATAALAGGVLACGGEAQVGDVVPRSTPELASPAETVLGDVKPADAEPSTPRASASAGKPTATAPAPAAARKQAVAPPAPPPAPAPAPAPPPPAQTTPVIKPAPSTASPAVPASPVTAAPQTTTPGSGGVPPGAFTEFCKQNPGACSG